MLNVARGSTYGWLFLLGAAAVALFVLRPAHSEDYGAGIFMLVVVIGAGSICLLLALVAVSAYLAAWHRGQLLLARDKAFAFASFCSIAWFVWPALWLVDGWV